MSATKEGRQLGGKIMALRQREEAIKKYYENPNYCKECNAIIEIGKSKVSIIKQKQFCSHSCSAKHSNKIRIRITKNKNVDSLSSSERKQVRDSLYLKTTKEFLFSKSSKAGDIMWQRARACITKHAQRVAQRFNLVEKCKICGYSSHVEVCHIKAVRDFPPEATLEEINSPTNLIGLCPNHHWEFDAGLLSLD